MYATGFSSNSDQPERPWNYSRVVSQTQAPISTIRRNSRNLSEEKCNKWRSTVCWPSIRLNGLIQEFCHAKRGPRAVHVCRSTRLHWGPPVENNARCVRCARCALCTEHMARVVTICRSAGPGHVAQTTPRRTCLSAVYSCLGLKCAMSIHVWCLKLKSKVRALPKAAEPGSNGINWNVHQLQNSVTVCLFCLCCWHTVGSSWKALGYRSRIAASIVCCFPPLAVVYSLPFSRPAAPKQRKERQRSKSNAPGEVPGSACLIDWTIPSVREKDKLFPGSHKGKLSIRMMHLRLCTTKTSQHNSIFLSLAIAASGSDKSFRSHGCSGNPFNWNMTLSLWLCVWGCQVTAQKPSDKIGQPHFMFLCCLPKVSSD